MSKAKQYLNEIVKKTKIVIGDDLVSIVLFGSLNNGEFVEGKSDVDMIVVTSNKKENRNYKDKLTEISKELSKKHKLNLYYNHGNLLERFAWNLVNSLGIRRSIFVTTWNEYENRDFFFCDSKLLANLLIPKNYVWNAVIKNSRAIYGKMPKAEIKKISIFDKIKEPFPSISAAFISILFWPFSREKSDYLKYASAKWMRFTEKNDSTKEKNNPILNFANILFESFKYYLK